MSSFPTHLNGFRLSNSTVLYIQLYYTYNCCAFRISPQNQFNINNTIIHSPVPRTVPRTVPPFVSYRKGRSPPTRTAEAKINQNRPTNGGFRPKSGNIAPTTRSDKFFIGQFHSVSYPKILTFPLYAVSEISEMCPIPGKNASFSSFSSKNWLRYQ